MEKTEGFRMELSCLRDTDKREVDFVVLKEGKPLFAVECQLSDKNVPSSLFYFAQRLSIPQYYLVHLGEKDYEHPHFPVRVLPSWTFVKEKELP